MLCILRINGNRADGAIFSYWDAPRSELPSLPIVGRFVETNSRLRIAGSIRLAGANIKCCACSIVWIQGNRADGVGGNASVGWTPVGCRREPIVRRPDTAAS